MSVIIQIIIVVYFCNVICFLSRPNCGATLSVEISLQMNFILESVIRSIPPDNVNDYSFENKKVIGRTFLLGMVSFLMYSNRFVNASLSIT